MKKLLSLLLALTFVVCLFSLSVVASAADEEEEKSIWDGEYKEFTAENGAVTRVFDNGCISTLYPDGSEERVDFDGNRFTKDKDGTQMAYMTDGLIGKKHADGTEEYKFIDGTKWIYKTDGTAITVNSLGLCTEYDKDENAKYMYFESGGKKITLDENGGHLLRTLRTNFLRDRHPQVRWKTYRTGTQQNHALTHHSVGSFDG